jgi:hypothetical protein
MLRAATILTFEKERKTYFTLCGSAFSPAGDRQKSVAVHAPLAAEHEQNYVNERRTHGTHYRQFSHRHVGYVVGKYVPYTGMEARSTCRVYSETSSKYEYRIPRLFCCHHRELFPIIHLFVGGRQKKTSGSRKTIPDLEVARARKIQIRPEPDQDSLHMVAGIPLKNMAPTPI